MKTTMQFEIEWDFPDADKLLTMLSRDGWERRFEIRTGEVTLVFNRKFEQDDRSIVGVFFIELSGEQPSAHWTTSAFEEIDESDQPKALYASYQALARAIDGYLKGDQP
jgi:hypothetical protein